jgi:hypothetical protein
MFYFLSLEFMCLLYMVPPKYLANYYEYNGLMISAKTFQT